ncbi:Bud site selection protein, Revert to axial protein 1, partial [Ceratobasidium sp. 395]
MSAPAPPQTIPPPLSAPDPKIDPTTAASSLPQAQLENLRYKITQIMESINGLMITLNAPQPGGVAGGLATWPELMTKYNVLLSKTHSLAASLSGPPTRKGQTSLKAIAPHPYATSQPPPAPPPAAPGTTQQPAAPPMDPQQIEAMLDALLDGRRSQSVLRADIANVARLRLPKDSTGPNAIGFGGGGIRVGQAGASTGLGGAGGLGGGMIGVREGPMSAEELRAEEARLDEVRRAHDARCARGVEAVRQLKDKYDWKSRLLFDDSDTDVGPLDSETGTQHEGDEEPGAPAGEEDLDDGEWDEIGVAPNPDPSPQLGMGVDIEIEDGTPTHTVFVPAEPDSDSESEDERPLNQPQMAIGRGDPTDGVGIVEGVGGDEDGSDSDGLEDVAPPFHPPTIQPQYNGGGGVNGNVQAEASPVSALENLWFRIGAMEKSARPASQQGGEYRNRLPTFEEVLSRKTRPPVDLFMFYLFLQREGAEDVLDFWLDVQQHENLCRAYFKDVRKSGRTIREDWPQYWEYARRRGSIYGHVVGLGNTSSPSSPNTTFGAGTGKRSTFNSAPDIDIEKRGRTPSPGPPLSGRPITPGGTGADGYRVARAPSATDDRDPRSTTPFEKARRTSGLFKRASRAPT